MNHPTGAEWNLADGLGSADGEGLEEVFCTAHTARLRRLTPLGKPRDQKVVRKATW